MKKPELAYPFVPAGDAQLRCFVFECLADADIHIDVLLANMEAAMQWVRGERTAVAVPFKQPRQLRSND